MTATETVFLSGFPDAYRLQFWTGRETSERFGRALSNRLEALSSTADSDEAWQASISDILVQAAELATNFPEQLLSESRLFSQGGSGDDESSVR